MGNVAERCSSGRVPGNERCGGTSRNRTRDSSVVDVVVSSPGGDVGIDMHVDICTMDALAVRVPIVMAMTVIVVYVPIAVLTGTVIAVTIAVAVAIMNIFVVVMYTVIAAVGPVVVTDDIGQRDGHWRSCWRTWLSTRSCCRCCCCYWPSSSCR